MHRLLPPSLVVCLIIAMVIASLAFRWPAANSSVQLAGLVVFVVGIALTVRNARLFDALGTNIKTFDDPDELVTYGAFAFTRNPMYLGFALLLIGVAMALGTAAAWIGPVSFVAAANQWYIPFEERRMRATFGADYDRYQARVRRWIGRRSNDA